MKRIGFSSWVVVVVAGLAIGGPGATTFGAQDQAPEALPRFEVASVKENRSGESRARMQTAPGGRFVATNAPLKLMIADAFLGPQPLAASRVFGGPEWIESARYDIDAKASTEFQPSPGGPPREMLLMLRALLEERFKLTARRETRQLPVYRAVPREGHG